MGRVWRTGLALSLALVLAGTASADARIDAMRRDKLGMFIHWGLYSIPAQGEWMMYHKKIPPSQYNRLADWFRQPASFSPRQWIAIAKRMGAKYAVFTTRHHDGFCLYDSQTTDFTSVKTAAGRDYVREFVEACREEGIRVGFYYSVMNWQYDPMAKGTFDRAVWDEQVRTTHEALRELMSNYGKIDYLWYDGCRAPGTNDSGTMRKMWKIDELNGMVRSLQPEILINDRSMMPEDFSTPEQNLVPPPRGRMWESCLTMNGMWGYVSADDNWKSPEMLFRSLLHCARFGGNMLLNIGPRADGSVPEACVKSLEEFGRMIARCPESIYGSERDEYTEATHEAGVVTKANGSYWLWALNSDKLDGAEKLERVGEGVYRVTRKAGTKPCHWLGGRHDMEIKSGDTPILGDNTGLEEPPDGDVVPLRLPEAKSIDFDLPSGGGWRLEVGYFNDEGFKDTHSVTVTKDAPCKVTVEIPCGKGIYAKRMSPVWSPIPPKSWKVAGCFPSRYQETHWSDAAIKEVFAKDLLAEAAKAEFLSVPAANDAADRSDRRINYNFAAAEKRNGYAFAKRNFPSDRDKTVIASFGVDWWGRVYLNGVLALEFSSGWKPKPFNLRLRKGDNEVIVVTHAGSGEHWFTFFTNETER